MEVKVPVYIFFINNDNKNNNNNVLIITPNKAQMMKTPSLWKLHAVISHHFQFLNLTLEPAKPRTDAPQFNVNKLVCVTVRPVKLRTTVGPGRAGPDRADLLGPCTHTDSYKIKAGILSYGEPVR